MSSVDLGGRRCQSNDQVLRKGRKPRGDETVISWIAKRCALHAYQRDTTNNRLKEDERNASLAFKRAAQEAKDEVYEDFCANVNEDRALFLFWKLYRDMQSKQRVQALDFSD